MDGMNELKRKHPTEEVTYNQQCKALFNMTMCKLSLPPKVNKDVSLRRAVLIFNTFKDIQLKLHSEGGMLPMPSLSDKLEHRDEDRTTPLIELSTVEAVCRDDTTMQDSQTAAKVPLISSDVSSLLLQDSITSGTASFTALDSITDNIASLPLQDSNSAISKTCDRHTASYPVDPTEGATMLDDLDLSIFDLDLAVPVSYNGTKTLMDTSKYSPVFMDWSGSSAWSPTATGTCKKDLWSDELDRIMEILVGS